jgi:hypothetical protein
VRKVRSWALRGSLEKSGALSWVSILLALALSGDAMAQDPSTSTAGHAAGATSAPSSITGKVIETMNAGGYTYVHVDDGKQKIWAAAPGFEVSVGDEVFVPPGAPMVDHHSKTLDRTFELIYFVGGISVSGSTPESADSPYVHAAGTPAEQALDLSGIAKAGGGKTIAEIFDGSAELAGQEVVVRGRVSKFTPKIMGTNFMHLRDGSSSKDGRNDLTVTTKTAVEVGALVLVRGVVSVDRDFGYGYKYDVLLEDASVNEE